MAALAKMAEKITSPDVDVSVLFTYNKGISNTIKVNQANAMILQKQEVSFSNKNIISFILDIINMFTIVFKYCIYDYWS